FFLKSAHLEGIRLFVTRWVMSYLKGPLTKEEISRLMGGKKQAESSDTAAARSESSDGYGSAPVLEASIPQHYEPDPSGSHRYRPWLAARCAIEYHDQRRGIDQNVTETDWLELDPAMNEAEWEGRQVEDLPFDRWPIKAPSQARFAPLPGFISQDSGLRKSAAALKDLLYQNERLSLFRCRKLRLESTPGESESDFKVRVREQLDELKEAEIDKLQERYGAKETRLQDQLKRAMDRVEKEKNDQTSSLISVGASILGALFGGRGPSASKIGTAINRSGRVLRERGDLSRAQERVEAVREKLEALADELEEKIDAIDAKYSLENYPIEPFALRPKKSDIHIEEIALVWRPAL
uniref:coiled-coil domain-containing protein n=1 Tax=Nitratifractor sp. TaxID=2268144 RepID=UPI00345D3567